MPGAIDFEITFDTIQIPIIVGEGMPMKIEKVNDNQIRCTLTKADLADREIKLSELAYGSEKAKNLFRDMMQQAALKFGFQADNIPLMIEAIPVNSECIVLIITKVEDPEELDTRFSRFTPNMDESDDDVMDDIDEEDPLARRKDEVLDLFRRISKGVGELTSQDGDHPAQKEEKDEEDKPVIIAKMFTFKSMSEVIKPAIALKGVYDDKNSLYKDTDNGTYVLVINKVNGTTEEFNRACNILSEYGELEKTLPSREFYYKEHFECVIEDVALQSLAKVM